MQVKRTFSVVLSLVIVAAIALLSGPDAWAKTKFKVLQRIPGGLFTGLTFDTEGNLYGATGGGGTHQDGTIFELTRQSNGKWTLATLHSFDGSDGYSPSGHLAFDRNGNLYGTAFDGGLPYYGGTIYKLKPLAGSWGFTLLYSFCPIYGCPDGAGPNGLILDKEHHLYGTTASGGLYDEGTVFELSHSSGFWNESVLYNFGSVSHDGVRPLDTPIFDSTGALYATTFYGGAYGGGTVFKLGQTAEGAWDEHILYSFCPGGAPCTDGVGPFEGVVRDNAGNLYGTTTQGGRHTCGETHCGTVFKLAPDWKGGWREAVLYDFPNPENGSFPTGGVVRDKTGSLFGATVGGGIGRCSGGCGVIYELRPGPGKWKYRALHKFDGSDGGQPLGGLILDNDLNLYGTAYSVVFEVTP